MTDTGIDDDRKAPPAAFRGRGGKIQNAASPYLMLFACLWPVFVLIWAGSEHGASRATLLPNAAVVIYFFFLARWDIVPHYARMAGLAAALVIAERGWGTGGLIFMLLLFAAIYFYLWYPAHEGVVKTMLFPMRNGVYMTVQGGRCGLTNYHVIAPQQRYALDIVKLNRGGARAAGLRPARLTAYAIFGEAVVSPCDGVVVEAVDGLPDLKPGDRDPVHAGGNHVLIQADGGGLLIHLSHLLLGSVVVRVGERVRRGQDVGRVGNSGNTSEPHLHIHAVRHAVRLAVRSGEADVPAAVPLWFENQWLIRNSIFRPSRRRSRDAANP